MSLNKRSTKRTSKSFTGCARCKEKKKKCDESPPACLACVRAGEECPGFVQQLRWSRKHERFEQSDGERPAVRRKLKPKPRPRAQVDSLDRQDESTPSSLCNGIEESPDVDSSTIAVNHSDLDAMFSQWLNAEFLPRDDLPLLGLNPPWAQFSTGFANDGTLWPTFDDLSDVTTPLNPYQGLQILPDSCDCETEPDRTQLVDDDYRELYLDAAKDHGGNSCLEKFYRMSTPTPYARFSADHLVKHYFTDVCSLISCFDSPLNPFRKLVASELPRSRTVSLAIQSMSIAHLANHYLYMAPLFIAKRCEAWKSLQSDLRRHRTGQVRLETVLLSLLLLGSSAPWGQPSNLGLPYLYIMRTLMQGYFRGGRTAKAQLRLKDEKFFVDALMHWEMLASFLDPFPMQSFPGYGMPDLQTSERNERKMPHPWTGASTQLGFALAEVGRILRRRQSRSKSFTDTSKAQPFDVHDEQWVAKLEDFLRSIRPSTPEDILDYGDKDTPKEDLVCISHAQRYAALLEIYREYPDLYDELLINETTLPSLHDQAINPTQAPTGYTKTLDASLCSITIDVLEALKDVSVSSSACRLLPLVLVSLAGHLRFPDQPFPGDEAQYSRHDQVVEARWSVESRMLELSTRYPQKQMLQILEIVKEVWDRLDNSQADTCHWMDVMHEKQLQTMMG